MTAERKFRSICTAFGKNASYETAALKQKARREFIAACDAVRASFEVVY
jgi:hypothetical protein